MPVVTTYESHISLVNMPTPENATKTEESTQKSPKMAIVTRKDEKSTHSRDIFESKATSGSSVLTTNATSLETRSAAACFMGNNQKTEKSTISTKTTPQTPPPSTSEPTNDVTQAYASPPPPNDAISRPLTIVTSASSSQHSQLPAGITDKKSTQLHALFKLQAPTESPAPASIATNFKMHSETA
jgi:hypothetical protein